MAQPLPNGMIDQLTVHERLELIGRLWDSLLDQEPPTPPSWHRAEVARRVAEADAHPEASISLEQLKRELRPDQA